MPVVKHICRFCTHYKDIGEWRGPTCGNPKSTEYRKRKSEEGTCNLFNNKTKKYEYVDLSEETDKETE